MSPIRIRTRAEWEADIAEIERLSGGNVEKRETLLRMNRDAREASEALARDAAARANLDRAGKLGPVAEHILKVLDENPGITKPAKIIALLNRKIVAGMKPDALRKAVKRAKEAQRDGTNREMSR